MIYICSTRLPIQRQFDVEGVRQPPSGVEKHRPLWYAPGQDELFITAMRNCDDDRAPGGVPVRANVRRWGLRLSGNSCPCDHVSALLTRRICYLRATVFIPVPRIRCCRPPTRTLLPNCLPSSPTTSKHRITVQCPSFLLLLSKCLYLLLELFIAPRVGLPSFRTTCAITHARQ